MIKRFRFSALGVAVTFTCVSLVALALFALPLWYAWNATIEDGRAAILESDVGRLSETFRRDGVKALATSIDTEAGLNFGERIHILMFLADPTFHKLAGNLPAWPRELGTTGRVQYTAIRVDRRVISAAILRRDLPGGYHLLVGRDVQRFERLEDLFIYGLLGAAGTVLLVGVIGGWLVRRTLLAKVQDINMAAHAIMQGKLSHRLPAHAGESELNALVETENRMLDQIELLVEGIRNVSNSIAHDLRTPLTELRSRLEEVSVTRPDPEQTYAEIEAAIGDVDRVIAIFNALLRMAEIDTGVRRAGFVEVDGSRIAAEAAEFYHPVAELKGVALVFVPKGPQRLAGDPLLLAQAIGNLIDNALKYVSENGRIRVSVTRVAGETIAITVADDGPGIPDEEKTRVLERFYRGDASRGTPGAGLGLSLVATVAKLHGGSLILADNDPGLKATLVLPALAGNDVDADARSGRSEGQ
ncbi:sensor histidine kinase [Massilia aerilata]|uniref:histidine kinase n=1 Tax=Massilia aerilata TaxID=453817 RepID=A0ABW0RWF8_9BURK